MSKNLLVKRVPSTSSSIFLTLLFDRGKQIILAADRTPAQLGMGSDGFDDRITSRMSGGIVIGIESPSYEMSSILFTSSATALLKREILLFLL